MSRAGQVGASMLKIVNSKSLLVPFNNGTEIVAEYANERRLLARIVRRSVVVIILIVFLFTSTA